MKPFLSELSDYAISLSNEKDKQFLPPLYWVSLGNGDADFHDNIILFGFDKTQPDPAFVAKVPRLSENGWMLKAEYEHLMELWSSIGIEAVNYVPKPYGFAAIQDKPVLIISYVSGESLTRLSPRSFWRDRQKVGVLAKEAARTLRALHRLTERPLQNKEPARLELQKKVDIFKQLFRLNAAEENTLAELLNTVDEAGKLARHEVLIQGDFWHGNMIRDKKYGHLTFIDWQFARWSVDVSLDVFFFLLAGALSATGSGPVEERAKLGFQLLSTWSKDLIPEYLAAYGVPDHYVILPQKYGMMLCCVEKAIRSVLDFGYSHPDDLLWRRLFGELQNWQMQD